jgi:hypothetical protein
MVVCLECRVRLLSGGVVVEGGLVRTDHWFGRAHIEARRSHGVAGGVLVVSFRSVEGVVPFIVSRGGRVWLGVGGECEELLTPGQRGRGVEWIAPRGTNVWCSGR